MSYFVPYGHSKNETKVELDLSSYATKFDSKNAIGVNTSQFSKKIYFASLKSDVNELDIDDLKKVSSGSNCLESKVDNLDVDKLKAVSVNLKN